MKPTLTMARDYALAALVRATERLVQGRRNAGPYDGCSHLEMDVYVAERRLVAADREVCESQVYRVTELEEFVF